MSFKIKIEPDAFNDIQSAIDWYNKQEKGLGKKFYTVIISTIDSLINNPYFENRYDEVRCLPLKKFPYMIHFTVEESTRIVTIRAVFHTSLNPDNWNKRNK